MRSGISDSRLRTEPMDSRGDSLAWISSSVSKICCCSLSRISAARTSMLRIRSNDTVELLFSFTEVTFVVGRRVVEEGQGRRTGA